MLKNPPEARTDPKDEECAWQRGGHSRGAGREKGPELTLSLLTACQVLTHTNTLSSPTTLGERDYCYPHPTDIKTDP